MPTNMSSKSGAPTRTFPKNAADFMRAVEDLFKRRYPVFVLDHDPSDQTYLVAWTDRTGSPRKTWITQLAMDQLTKHWVFN